MKYLIVFEDGSFKQYNEISKDDIKMVEDGYCSIIKKDKYKDNFKELNIDGAWEIVKQHDANCEDSE